MRYKYVEKSKRPHGRLDVPHMMLNPRLRSNHSSSSRLRTPLGSQSGEDIPPPHPFGSVPGSAQWFVSPASSSGEPRSWVDFLDVSHSFFPSHPLERGHCFRYEPFELVVLDLIPMLISSVAMIGLPLRHLVPR